MDIDSLLKLVVEKGASDLHLKVPNKPVIRVDGDLVPQEDMEVLRPQDLQDIYEQITTQEQRIKFNREKELDFAYSVANLARFRVNVMRQRGSLAIAFRMVPFKIPTIDDMQLPQILKQLILKPRGLVLVTGPTGSGKSTTLAAMINHLNDNDRRSVITIEDPIEFLYKDNKCVIAQRDIGDDTNSFPIALKHALRHDPDVIVVGEMRDLETISTAIMAAETGHLVLGTLHTTDAAQTVDRVIDIFPHGQQRQIRLQMSQVIEAILCQALLPRIGGGRVAAFEIMIASTAVRNLIREEKTFELPSVMQTGTRDGMYTLDQSLSELIRQQSITMEEALKKSSKPESLKRLISYQQSNKMAM